MGWSIKLFDVGSAAAVRIHMTFFLLLVWIGAIHWARGGAGEALDGIIFIVLLFGSVVLHEFGHALAAALRHQDPGHHVAADRRRRPAGAHAGEAAGVGRGVRRARRERS